MKAKTKTNPNPAGACRNHLSSVLLPVLLTIGLMMGIGVCPAPARAQVAGAQPVWQALVTPYFWAPWTDIGIHPANPRLPNASGTVGFDQLVDHLSWVPFNGQIEFRNGPYSFLGDFIHAPVRTGITTHNIVFGGGSSGLTVDTGTAMFLYRPIEEPDQYLDAGMGVRVWGFGGNVTLNEGLLPRRLTSRSVAPGPTRFLRCAIIANWGMGLARPPTAMSVASASVPISIGR